MADDRPSAGDAYYHSSSYEVVYHVTDDGHVLTFTEYSDVATFLENHGTPDEQVDEVADLPAPGDVELSSSEE